MVCLGTTVESHCSFSNLKLIKKENEGSVLVEQVGKLSLAKTIKLRMTLKVQKKEVIFLKGKISK